MSIRLFAKIHLFLIFISMLSVMGSNHSIAASDSDFEKLQRGHFIIYHNNKNFANKLSWKAEYHYKRIVRHLGVREFRPWEGKDKCPIYLYKTKDAYLDGTGAPEWSVGLAQYRLFRFSSYEDAPDLLLDTLPHEMTHMILYLFMDKKPIPRWLSEGMAQFEEQNQSSAYQRKRSIKWYVKKKKHIPINTLLKMKTIPKDDIDLFYVESASIIDHLITDNIRASFGKFLMCIKNGDTVSEALKKSYQRKYKNGISDLEKHWLDFIHRKY